MMFSVLTVVGLTLVYALGLASFAWEDLAVGAVASTALMLIYRPYLYPRVSPKAEFVMHLLVRVPLLLGMMMMDILRGTWQVAIYVLGLKQMEHPGIVKIPFGNHSDEAIGFIGVVVTISPGSFVVDLDWTDRTMLVHYMDASEPEKLRNSVEKYYRLWEYGTHVPPIRQGIHQPDLPKGGD